MTKAIILTYAPVSLEEKTILKSTNIFKIALNHHAEEFNPDARIISDYNLRKMYQNFKEKIVSVRDDALPESDRIEYFRENYKGATIVSAVQYLISKKYNEILIVGTNQVNSCDFQDLIRQEIKKLSEDAVLFQYSNGNFDLPVKNISEFCA